MTNHYDEMRVSPDPWQAEELRQRLHARMAGAPPEEHPDGLEPEVPVIWMTDFSGSLTSRSGTAGSDTSVAATSTRRDRTYRRLLVVATAAIVIAIGAAAIVISNRGSDGVRSVPAAPPTTTPTTPPRGEKIRVTPNLIQLGDGLVGNASFAKDDGRTYVVAGHFDAADSPSNDPEENLWWFRTETAVLVAFDDAGVELWRTELDRPSQVVVTDGDVWLADDVRSDRDSGTLSRVDASTGRIVDRVNVGRHASILGAFGSVWVEAGPAGKRTKLIRVDRDGSTTTIKLPDLVVTVDDSQCGDPVCAPAAAGPDAIWAPLGENGVARIDSDTNKVKVIKADDVGHEVTKVAFDGDVTYVAGDSQVTSIVDGKVVATVTTGPVGYLGPIDGVVGVSPRGGLQFRVLRPKPPMLRGYRLISIKGRLNPTEGWTAGREFDGEAWMETGRNYSLLRVHLLPATTKR